LKKHYTVSSNMEIYCHQRIMYALVMRKGRLYRQVIILFFVTHNYIRNEEGLITLIPHRNKQKTGTYATTHATG
jgi:cAMP phosphodiesterase